MKRYLKKCLVSAIAISTLSMAANDVSAKEEISVYYNNKKVSFDSVEPLIENGRTLIPMRKIFEVLDATVDWDHSTKTITAKKDGKTIQLKIGSKTVGVNELSGLNVNQTIDAAPKIYQSKTMVPLRFVSESLGAQVEWNDDHRIIHINNGKEHHASFSFVKKDGNYEIKKDHVTIGSLIDQGNSYSLYLDDYKDLSSLSYAAKVARDYGFPMNDSEFIHLERYSKSFEETPKIFEYKGVQYTSFVHGAIDTWELEWIKENTPNYSLVKNENSGYDHAEVSVLLKDGKSVGTIYEYDDSYILILSYHDNKEDVEFAWEVVSERGFNMPKDEFMSMEIKGKLMLDPNTPTYEYNGMTYVSYLRSGPGDWKLQWNK